MGSNFITFLKVLDIFVMPELTVNPGTGRHSPRIKGIQRQRIYKIDKNKNYGSLGAVDISS